MWGCTKECGDGAECNTHKEICTKGMDGINEAKELDGIILKYGEKRANDSGKLQ